MKRTLTLFLSLMPIIAILITSASAHPGKTDSNGGHYDHDTGEYHYHHGYPAHDHYDMDGDGDIDCPYDFDDKTNHNESDSNSSSESAYERRRRELMEKYGTPTEPPITTYTDNVTTSSTDRSSNDGMVAILAICLYLVIPAILLISEFVKGLRESAKIRKENRETLDKIGASSVKLPSGIVITNSGDISDGSPDSQHPYGKYTVYVAKSGKVFHTDPFCCKTGRAQHIFEINRNLSACKRCSRYKTLPTSAPEWYIQIKKALNSQDVEQLVDPPKANQPSKNKNVEKETGEVRVESSCIAAVEYYDEAIYITFKTGGKYCYYNVPKAVYTDLLASQSKGTFFHKNIEGKYPCVPI